MKNNQIFTPLVKFVIVTAGLIIIIAGLKTASEMFLIFFFTLIFAVVLTPMKKWLESKGMPGWLSLLVTFLLTLLVFVGIIWFVIISVTQLIEVLPEYADSAEQLKSDISELLAQIGIDFSGILSSLGIQNVLDLVAGFLISLFSSLADVVVILLILFFLLLTEAGISKGVNRIFEADNQMVSQFMVFFGQIREYLLITTKVNFIVGLVDAVLLLALGVPFPFLWGLLAFFMGYIPSIGFWIALIPPFIITLLQYGLARAMILLIGYVLINGGVQNFIEPRLYGKGLNLSPLVVILSLVIWAAILGPLGALIAVPLTMMVMRLILEVSPDTRWLAALMSADK